MTLGLSIEMNSHRSSVLLCIVLTFIILSVNAASSSKESSTVKNKLTNTDDHTCDWGCDANDTKLQACEARCLLEFRQNDGGQRDCQNVCAVKYLNCLEMCSKNVWLV